MAITGNCRNPEAALMMLGDDKVWYDLFTYLQLLDHGERSFPTVETPLRGHPDVLLKPIQFDFQTGQQQKVFETHLDNVDVHYCHKGKEIIEVKPLFALSPAGEYDGQKDVWLHVPNKNPFQVSIGMSQGSFAILLPSDGHRPLQWPEKSGSITKLVAKVPIEYRP